MKPFTLLSVFLAASLLTPSFGQSFDRSVRKVDNREPSIPRPQQEAQVAEKLANLYKKTGKRPNIVWIIVDDMGYGDPGCYGGGEVA
ncbi:MAG: arylsulfatase, partial [bacterium]